MTQRRHASLALQLIAVWVLACTPEPGASHDQHVELSLDNDAREVCAGSIPHLDRYIERIFSFFGVAAPAYLNVPVLVVGTESPCADLYSSSSCYVAAEETVYLADLDLEGRRTLGVVRHELGHAVIDRLWGQSAPFFNEGLAESLSQTLDRATPPPPAPVGDMLDRIPAEVDYTAAAYFVRFLVDTRGLERFKQVFQRSLGRSRADIEALMASFYGESFQALEAEYLSGPARCQYQLDVCEPESAIAVGDRFHLTRAASCDDPDFYGSAGEDDLDIAAQQTIEVRTGGTYRLEIAYDVPPLSTEYPRSQVVMTRCGDCEEQSIRTFRQADEELQLEAGIYALEMVMPFDTVVTIDLQRVGP